MGKSTISMVIFNSYVSLPEGTLEGDCNPLINSRFVNPGLTLVETQGMWPNWVLIKATSSSKKQDGSHEPE